MSFTVKTFDLLRIYQKVLENLRREEKILQCCSIKISLSPTGKKCKFYHFVLQYLIPSGEFAVGDKVL